MPARFSPLSRLCAFRHALMLLPLFAYSTQHDNMATSVEYEYHTYSIYDNTY